jgi:hypothetical protein
MTTNQINSLAAAKEQILWSLFIVHGIVQGTESMTTAAGSCKTVQRQLFEKKGIILKKMKLF